MINKKLTYKRMESKSFSGRKRPAISHGGYRLPGVVMMDQVEIKSFIGDLKKVVGEASKCTKGYSRLNGGKMCACLR